MRAGQILVDLNSREVNSAFEARRLELAAIDAEIARRSAAIFSLRGDKIIEPVFSGPDSQAEAEQRAAFHADVEKYAADRRALKSQIEENRATADRLAGALAARRRLQAILLERAGMREALAAKAVNSRASVLDASQQVEQAAADLAHDEGQLAETGAARASLGRKLEQLYADEEAHQTQALTEAAAKRGPAAQEAVRVGLARERTHLLAPIGGTVQQVSATSPGQVVSAGQPMLVVVPSDVPYEVEALVPDREIAFVAPGQRALIKVDAFPFTRYGALSGTVAQVSRDAASGRSARAASDPVATAQGQTIEAATGLPETEDLVYPVTIRLDRQSVPIKGGAAPLAPGMTAQVEVRTGRRRVIEYLLAPILETASGAWHER